MWLATVGKQITMSSSLLRRAGHRITTAAAKREQPAVPKRADKTFFRGPLVNGLDTGHLDTKIRAYDAAATGVVVATAALKEHTFAFAQGCCQVVFGVVQEKHRKRKDQDAYLCTVEDGIHDSFGKFLRRDR